MKFFGGLGCALRIKWLDFGGDQERDLDPGIFLKDAYSRLYQVSSVHLIVGLWSLLLVSLIQCNDTSASHFDGSLRKINLK